MFTDIIVRPIFNLLVLIYALLPGHDLGMSIIIFTIIIRLLMWPLVKKQLRQAKAMRELQPEVKRIKKSAAGNKQKESQMLMELYKEREVSPFGSIGTLVVQLIILIGLYSGLRKVITNPESLVNFAYPALQHLPWIKHLSSNIQDFHNTLFGIIDLSKSAIGKGGIYWPAMILVLGSAIIQYYTSKQLMPSDKNSRKLRDILKDASSGQSADQSEVNAAVGRGTRYILPVMVFLFTVSYPAMLSLYWLVGGIVAYIQQAIILREDTEELEKAVEAKEKKDPSKITEAEVVENKTARKSKPRKKKKTSSKKRRKK